MRTTETALKMNNLNDLVVEKADFKKSAFSATVKSQSNSFYQNSTIEIIYI